MKWQYLMRWPYLITSDVPCPPCVQCIHFKNAQDVRFGKCELFPKDAYGDPYHTQLDTGPADYTFCFIAWKKCQGKFYRDIR